LTAPGRDAESPISRLSPPPLALALESGLAGRGESRALLRAAIFRHGLLVRRASVGCRYQGDYTLALVDLIEEPPRPYSIAPGLGHVAPELPNVWSEVGTHPELQVDDLLELPGHVRMTALGDALQVLCELPGLEDPVLSRQTGLAAPLRPRTPPSAARAIAHLSE